MTAELALGERALLVAGVIRRPVAETDGPDRGGVDHTLDLVLETRVHHVGRPADVALVDLVRVGRPEAVLGCDVEDLVAAGDGSRHSGRVAQITDTDLRLEAADVAPVGRAPDQERQVATTLEQRARDARAHESSSSSDECSLQRFLPGRRCEDRRHAKVGPRRGLATQFPLRRVV